MRRILLVFPTLFCIIAINFLVVQLAPGGPVQSILEKLHHPAAGGEVAMAPGGVYRGAQGLDAGMVAQLNQEFGLDQPPLKRFWIMLRGYARFDLGVSFFQGEPVATLIWQRLPVSLSLGLWSTLIVYLVSVPLGLAKAIRDGGRFDVISSVMVLAAYAVPGFLLAIFALVLFGQGGLAPLFPLRGLARMGAPDFSWPMRIADYAWHLVLPTLAMIAGGFASITMLTKNSVMEEIAKLYVLTARSKGASEWRVMFRHVLPNAMLLVIAGLPAAFTAILFTSALLVEIVFSLNGLGLLGFNAVLQRDYPVMFGTLYVYTITGLVMQILGDFLLTVVDPRIDFERR